MHYICSEFVRNRRLTRQNIILLILAGLLSSCFDDGDCITTTTDVLHINFKKYTTSEVDTVEIIGITITGTDSVFYPAVDASSITLPLDPNASSLTINFDFELVDRELILDYNTTPRLISPDCGVELSFTNISVDENNYDFDSVAVRFTFLDEQITPNIVIYQ